MTYLAVLGRQAKISLAELESLFQDVRQIAPELAEFTAGSSGTIADTAGSSEPLSSVVRNGRFLDNAPQIARLGGTQKLAVKLARGFDEVIASLPETGKITIGVSDYSPGATAFRAQGEALKLKRRLTKQRHSVRVVANRTAVLSSATSYHNHLFDANKIELIKFGKDLYRVIGVQNIDAYAERDQSRPARDAKVGMLPPKLAQILINLCGDLPAGSRLLDPFCGTGVVLQEAALMGYIPYGTDLSERMVEYSRRNLEWLYEAGCKGRHFRDSVSLSEEALLPVGVVSGKVEQAQLSARLLHSSNPSLRSGRDSDPAQPGNNLEKLASPLARQLPSLAQGDATNFHWQPPLDAVACEVYLGQPMSQPPAEIKLKQEKQECQTIILGFLRNLARQITSETPVVIAVPAWLRPNGEYERLNLLDEIKNLGYNVRSFRNLGQKDLLYHRDGQVVAREIIVLRKK